MASGDTRKRRSAGSQWPVFDCGGAGRDEHDEEEPRSIGLDASGFQHPEIDESPEKKMASTVTVKRVMMRAGMRTTPTAANVERLDAGLNSERWHALAKCASDSTLINASFVERRRRRLSLNNEKRPRLLKFDDGNGRRSRGIDEGKSAIVESGHVSSARVESTTVVVKLNEESVARPDDFLNDARHSMGSCTDRVRDDHPDHHAQCSSPVYRSRSPVLDNTFLLTRICNRQEDATKESIVESSATFLLDESPSSQGVVTATKLPQAQLPEAIAKFPVFDEGDNHDREEEDGEMPEIIEATQEEDLPIRPHDSPSKPRSQATILETQCGASLSPSRGEQTTRPAIDESQIPVSRTQSSANNRNRISLDPSPDVLWPEANAEDDDGVPPRFPAYENKHVDGRRATVRLTAFAEKLQRRVALAASATNIWRHEREQYSEEQPLMRVQLECVERVYGVVWGRGHACGDLSSPGAGRSDASPPRVVQLVLLNGASSFACLDSVGKAGDCLEGIGCLEEGVKRRLPVVLVYAPITNVSNTVLGDCGVVLVERFVLLWGVGQNEENMANKRG